MFLLGIRRILEEAPVDNDEFTVDEAFLILSRLNSSKYIGTGMSVQTSRKLEDNIEKKEH